LEFFLVCTRLHKFPDQSSLHVHDHRRREFPTIIPMGIRRGGRYAYLGRKILLEVATQQANGRAI
jgi:hypothetical protein